MDEERKRRLQQLDQRFLSGEITEEEEKEYRSLQEEQSVELTNAMTRLAQKQFKFRLPFLRRKS